MVEQIFKKKYSVLLEIEENWPCALKNKQHDLRNDSILSAKEENNQCAEQKQGNGKHALRRNKLDSLDISFALRNRRNQML